MTNYEGYRPPAIVDLPFAPSMQVMERGQTFRIDEFGGREAMGNPLTVNLGGEQHTFKGLLPSVRVIIGDDKRYDFLEVVDVSAHPWYDSRTQKAGNFALFRWSEVQLGRREVVSVNAMRLGEIFAIGRTNPFGKHAEHPLPPTVRDRHVSIGIEVDKSTWQERLVIKNHDHKARTEVWNLQCGTTVARNALVGENFSASKRRAAWHIGSTSTRKATES